MNTITTAYEIPCYPKGNTYRFDAPYGGVFRSAGMIGGKLFAWAEAPEGNPVESVEIQTVRDGEPMPFLGDGNFRKFIGTVIVPGGTVRGTMTFEDMKAAVDDPQTVTIRDPEYALHVYQVFRSKSGFVEVHTQGGHRAPGL